MPDTLAEENTVIATISVGEGSRSIEFDSVNNRMYVTNGDDDTVSVINTATNGVIETISVGDAPYGMAFDSANNRMYVTNAFDNTISVINTATNVVDATIAAGTNPVDVALDSANDRLYVTNYNQGIITVIDTDDNTIITTISVGGPGNFPLHIAFDSTNDRMYVTEWKGHEVSVINTATNAVDATISVGTNPYGMAFDSANNRMYVADNADDTVSVIDIAPVAEESTTGDEKKSDSECSDCTAPSLGISQNHKDPVRVIDDGITFNEKSFDVREFAKIYDTIDTKTGVTNTIQLKIYEDSKPENVRKAILYLGLDSSDIYRNIACIIWENNSYGEKTITIIDKFDLFEDESAKSKIVDDILFLNYTFTSKIPIPTTIAVELRDNYYNFGLNYFENVIKVSGNPLIASTGTVSKNNSVQTLIVDTFQNESSGSQNDVMSPEFESGAPYEIPSIMIADTSQWGFSDVMTQRYLADIEETIQQNDSKIQAMRNADVPIEIPVVEEELPRIEENLLQIEQQKAQLILNEILREDIHNWKKVYDPQTFEIDVKQVSALTGIPYDSLQPWMSNLETWVAEGTIDSSELVIAVEYLTNN